MPYGLGVIGVVCVNVGMAVAGSVGICEAVGGAVVTVGSDVCEAVGNVGMIVIPGTGVRVGMFGTHSR